MPTAAAISSIGPRDIARGMALVHMAGWNQTIQDWEMMLRLGRGYGIRDQNGDLLASSIVIRYPPAIGWIGMVLVDEVARRQGLATRLVQNAVAIFRDEGLTPCLDATPAGRDVYLRFGFQDVAPVSRWRGMGGGRSSSIIARGQTPAPPAMEPGVALDAAAFSGRRQALLDELSARRDSLTLTGGTGYLWSRIGRTATQIGPVVATHPDDGMTLVATALDCVKGPVLLDVPDSQQALSTMLAARGYSIERPFNRMALGGTLSLRLGPTMRVTAGPDVG